MGGSSEPPQPPMDPPLLLLYFNCLLDVMWLLVFCVSSLQCHELVCSVLRPLIASAAVGSKAVLLRLIHCSLMLLLSVFFCVQSLLCCAVSSAFPLSHGAMS